MNNFRLDSHNDQRTTVLLNGEAFLCEDLEALLSPGKLNVERKIHGDPAEFRKFSKISRFFLPFLIVHDIHES